MPQLTQNADVFILNLGGGENRFHPDWIARFNAALDQVEAAEGAKALVTAADGKFWSNGLDLEWLGANPDGLKTYLAAVHDLLARVLVLPVPTVAAIGGHCFAAGAMMAMAHDFRVMRADRGFFCLPEVDLRLPFTPGMSALIQARLPVGTAHTAMTTGRRYGGHDALAAGIASQVAGEGKVLVAALEVARPLTTKAGATLGAIKTGMYGDVLRALRGDGAGARNGA